MLIDLNLYELWTFLEIIFMCNISCHDKQKITSLIYLQTLILQLFY